MGLGLVMYSCEALFVPALSCWIYVFCVRAIRTNGRTSDGQTTLGPDRPVHAKSPEEIKAITHKMENNFMFNSLNPVDKKMILNAVVPVTKLQGEAIIK